MFNQSSLWHHVSKYSRVVAHNAVWWLVLGLIYFSLIYLIERFTGARTHQYRTRGFLQDIAYWFYSRSGFGRLTTTTVVYSLLIPRLAFLNVKLLLGLPIVLRWTIYFLVTDLITYWVHRWTHYNRFFWAFHTTHHSQEHMSFLTSFRAHPVDLLTIDLVMLLPILVLGGNVKEWLPFYYLIQFLIVMQHSEIPWRLGPLYYVIVSPVFHSYHHSTRVEHHDRNFGRILSIWDFMFGTAVDKKERAKEYGLADLKMPTLASTFLLPFRMAYQTCFNKPRQASSARLAVP
jgi:sterol desaturase/sphingolipid hydroxylase (fatty acid hydroxylase superfamily)